MLAQAIVQQFVQETFCKRCLFLTDVTGKFYN